MLLIYAHPNKTGHCGYILKEFEKHFKKSRRKYKVLDLYKMKFDPVLKASEHYTSGHREIAPQVKKIQDLIKKERKFIFIYPTWWNSPPAIMKGFFDRVLVSHFAFKYINGIPRGLLKGKALVFTTSGGPFIYEYFIAKLRSLKIATKDSLRFCGLKTKGVLISFARKLTDPQKKKIERKVKKSLPYILS
jgi:NAD(P)H dehydrogenase (quinone)